jgi:hypothetical protein
MNTGIGIYSTVFLPCNGYSVRGVALVSHGYWDRDIRYFYHVTDTRSGVYSNSGFSWILGSGYTVFLTCNGYSVRGVALVSLGYWDRDIFSICNGYSARGVALVSHGYRDRDIFLPCNGYSD